MDGKREENIKSLEKQFQTIRQDVEVIKSKFLKATETYMQKYFENEAERAVVSQPDLTRSTGKETLGTLKRELRQLIGSMPKLIQEHVNRDYYWPHEMELDADSPPRFERHGSRLRGARVTSLDDGVRLVVGHLGALLQKYGFIDFKSALAIWDPGVRAHTAADTGGSNPRLRNGYEWSEEMNALCRQYAVKYEELRPLDRQLKAARRERAEQEARDMWHAA